MERAREQVERRTVRIQDARKRRRSAESLKEVLVAVVLACGCPGDAEHDDVSRNERYARHDYH